MLEKKYRLCKRKQFNYIYKKGRTVGCDFLTLVYCFSKMPNIRVGFSASKKVGGSVQRHRALRKMREAIRVTQTPPDLAPLKRMAANNNYIFVAKETLLEKSISDIQTACINLLKRAQLLK